MNIKGKFGGAIMATALGATLIGAGTSALFTSSTSNQGNTFTAGTVVVTDKTGGTLASQEVNFGNLAPGDHNSLKMAVKNEGTLDEWVKIDRASTDQTKAGELFSGSTPIGLSYSDEVILLHPGETHKFTVDYNFPSTADNSYQGKTGSFNVVVDAVQDRNNTNASGNGPESWQ